MSRKHFSWLLIVTLAVTALVLLMPGKTGKESSFEKTRLLPGLQQQVNELDWLRFTGAGDVTIATLQRSDGQWQVEEARGYRADWNRLRTLLAELSNAEIIEAKTANPEYYGRLGVADISLADAGGVRIEFGSDTGLPAVIVGQRAQGRDGQYVRLEGSAASALIDRQLDVPADMPAWLDRSIVDISDTEVVAFDIRHADGERIAARKISADDENFELEGVPDGRETRSAWTVNSVANGLATLTLEEVAPDSEVDWSGAVHFGLVTADGLRMDADLVAVAASRDVDAESAEAAEAADAAGEPASEHWIRLQAGLYQTAVAGGVTPAADEAGPEADASGRAEAINRRVAGWAYRIPQYKFDTMNKRMEDLLKAPEAAKN